MVERARQTVGRPLAALVNSRLFKPAVFVACLYPGVDLGWRLWASGQRVLAAPRAVVHHRSGATSELLGLYRRGFLF